MEPTIVVAIVAAAGALITACIQYTSKVREEKRLTKLAQIEADTRIAASFAALMSRAHGRGETVLSEAAAQCILENGGAFKEQVLATLAQVVRGEEGRAAVARVDMALDATLRTYPVGSADMDAAMQILVALGLRHPLLTRAAKVGVSGRHKFKPVEGFDEIVDALVEREAYDARRLRWARTTRPAYWLGRSVKSASRCTKSTRKRNEFSPSKEGIIGGRVQTGQSGAQEP